MTRGPRGARRGDDAKPSRPIGPLFMLFFGALGGRFASELLAPGALGLFDLFVYAGLALGVALAWRRFAHRAMAQRRRDRERRARVASDVPQAPPPEDRP